MAPSSAIILPIPSSSDMGRVQGELLAGAVEQQILNDPTKMFQYSELIPAFDAAFKNDPLYSPTWVDPLYTYSSSGNFMAGFGLAGIVGSIVAPELTVPLAFLGIGADRLINATLEERAQLAKDIILSDPTIPSQIGNSVRQKIHEAQTLSRDFYPNPLDPTLQASERYLGWTKKLLDNDLIPLPTENILEYSETFDRLYDKSTPSRRKALDDSIAEARSARDQAPPGEGNQAYRKTLEVKTRERSVEVINELTNEMDSTITDEIESIPLDFPPEFTPEQQLQQIQQNAQNLVGYAATMGAIIGLTDPALGARFTQIMSGTAQIYQAVASMTVPGIAASAAAGSLVFGGIGGAIMIASALAAKPAGPDPVLVALQGVMKALTVINTKIEQIGTLLVNVGSNVDALLAASRWQSYITRVNYAQLQQSVSLLYRVLVNSQIAEQHSDILEIFARASAIETANDDVILVLNELLLTGLVHASKPETSAQDFWSDNPAAIEPDNFDIYLSTVNYRDAESGAVVSLSLANVFGVIVDVVRSGSSALLASPQDPANTWTAPPTLSASVAALSIADGSRVLSPKLWSLVTDLTVHLLRLHPMARTPAIGNAAQLTSMPYRLANLAAGGEWIAAQLAAARQPAMLRWAVERYQKSVGRFLWQCARSVEQYIVGELGDEQNPIVKRDQKLLSKYSNKDASHRVADMPNPVVDLPLGAFFGLPADLGWRDMVFMLPMEDSEDQISKPPSDDAFWLGYVLGLFTEAAAEGNSDQETLDPQVPEPFRYGGRGFEQSLHLSMAPDGTGFSRTYYVSDRRLVDEPSTWAPEAANLDIPAPPLPIMSYYKHDRTGKIYLYVGHTMTAAANIDDLPYRLIHALFAPLKERGNEFSTEKKYVFAIVNGEAYAVVQQFAGRLDSNTYPKALNFPHAFQSVHSVPYIEAVIWHSRVPRTEWDIPAPERRTEVVEFYGKLRGRCLSILGETLRAAVFAQPTLWKGMLDEMRRDYWALHALLVARLGRQAAADPSMLEFIMSPPAMLTKEGQNSFLTGGDFSVLPFGWELMKLCLRPADGQRTSNTNKLDQQHFLSALESGWRSHSLKKPMVFIRDEHATTYAPVVDIILNGKELNLGRHSIVSELLGIKPVSDGEDLKFVMQEGDPVDTNGPPYIKEPRPGAEGGGAGFSTDPLVGALDRLLVLREVAWIGTYENHLQGTEVGGS